jgi:hypothetical protein
MYYRKNNVLGASDVGVTGVLKILFAKLQLGISNDGEPESVMFLFFC